MSQSGIMPRIDINEERRKEEFERDAQMAAVEILVKQLNAKGTTIGFPATLQYFTDHSCNSSTGYHCYTFFERTWMPTSHIPLDQFLQSFGLTMPEFNVFGLQVEDAFLIIIKYVISAKAPIYGRYASVEPQIQIALKSDPRKKLRLLRFASEDSEVRRKMLNTFGLPHGLLLFPPDVIIDYPPE